MKKVLYLWCLKEKAEGERGYYNFDDESDFYICSRECRNAVTVKRGGKVLLDSAKVNKHIKQILREKRRDAKSREIKRLLSCGKLGDADMAALFGTLTEKQKKALAIIGLHNMAWSVDGDPVMLMQNLNQLVKDMKR